MYTGGYFLRGHSVYTNLAPISYRFQDKRRFSSVKANFPIIRVLSPGDRVTMGIFNRITDCWSYQRVRKCCVTSEAGKQSA